MNRSLVASFVSCTSCLAFLGAATIAPAVADPAGSAQIGDLTITEAWTRQAPPRATTGGAYLTIRNDGAEGDVLISGSAAFAERLEVHEMAVSDGVMTMRLLPLGLPVPAGETVVLEPGGLHIMMLGLDPTPTAGETADMVLRFAKAGDVPITMPVAPIGARGLEAHTDHPAKQH